MTIVDGAELSLPSWFREFRPHQVTAIAEILDAYRSGVRVVVLDAPTGSGKTLVAEAVRQGLGNVNGLYVCTTKSLQDQFAHDYPYASVLKGRANYPTERYPSAFTRRWDRITADDCNKSDGKGCTLCWDTRSCPYEVAKGSALMAGLAVLNTSYFLTEVNGPGRFSGRELVIADECDMLEGELSRYISVEISAKRVKELGLGEPAYVTKMESWEEWVKNAIEVVRGRVRDLSGTSTDDIKGQREARYLSRLLQRLSTLSVGLPDGQWIYTGKGGEVSFKPVLVDKLGAGAFYAHAKHFLLMSATVISAEELLRSTGWKGEYRVVTVDSTFPAARRPVVYRPIANMTKDGRDNGEWEKCARGIGEILAAHSDDRILVHCVSYALAKYLHEHVDTSGREGIIYVDGSERGAALKRYRGSDRAVIFAASLDRGIDLPGDECRVQVVAKVPYANLGDRQVSARLYSPTKREGNRWYKVQAIRTLVQMCGRGMRSEEDSVKTYILDSNFETGLWGEWRHLWPKWWREALRWKE